MHPDHEANLFSDGAKLLPQTHSYSMHGKTSARLIRPNHRMNVPMQCPACQESIWQCEVTNSEDLPTEDPIEHAVAVA